MGKQGEGKAAAVENQTPPGSRLSGRTRSHPLAYLQAPAASAGVLPFAPSAAADTRIPSSPELGSRRALLPSAGLD